MICGIFFLWVLYTIHLAQGLDEPEHDSVTEIRKQILKDYDKTLSPALYKNKTFYTTILVSLMRIRDLDAEKGEFTTECIITFGWNDPRLRWESEKFRFLRIPADNLWIPKLNIANRLEPEENCVDPLPVVYKKAIWYARKFVMKTACIPDLKLYPFDKQTCGIEIVALADEREFLTLKYPSSAVKNTAVLRMGFVVENIQWDLLSGERIQEEQVLDRTYDSTVEVFRFTIQRRMPLIPLGILTPSVISVLLLLTTFWMKSNYTIRTGINSTSLIVISSSIFTLGKLIPVTGTSTPIIVEYCTTALLLTMLSTLQGIVISTLSTSTRPPPVSYTYIINSFPKWMRYILQVSPPSEDNISTDQAFLFSELSESTNKENLEQEEVELRPKPSTRQQIQEDLNSWKYHVVLIDRISFYVYAIVIILFVLSVIINM